MPRSLYFNESGVAEEIIIGDYDPEDKTNKLLWVNLREYDDFQAIPEAIDKSKSFQEDLVEEQRPRAAIYQTLEDNQDTFSVVVFAVPTAEVFNDDDFQLQITFILLRNKIYSIASMKNNIIGEVMSKAILRKDEFTVTSLFNFILTELFEMGIRVLLQVEDYVDQLERKIIRSSLSNQLLTSLLVLKSRLFDAAKLVKADLEPIREIKDGLVPELLEAEVTDQSEDRALFLLDLIETQREDLSNVINLQLAIASNSMNHQFYWLTILGAILVIPTIISSIWGMNIPVPQIGFWWMMLLMFLMTLGTALIVRWLLPKPTLV